MKTVLLVLLFSSGMFAQNTLSLTATPATVRAGGSLTVSVNYSAANTAGLQWVMAFPAGVTVTSATAVAGKTLSCRTDSTLCVLYGINQTIIPVGQVASFVLAFPASAAIGPATVTLSAPLGASAAGVSVPVAAGPPLTISVTRPLQDLNGDGVVNVQDVQAALNQVIGTVACTTADINGVNGCNLIDVMLVILAALGL